MLASNAAGFKLIADGLLQHWGIAIPMKKTELYPWLNTLSVLPI